MVRVIDLDSAVSSDLDSSGNYMLVTGFSNDIGVKRVSVGQFGRFFNDTIALDTAGVNARINALVDSNYVQSKLLGLPFSSIQSKPTTRNGYGITDVIRYTDISVTQNNPSNVASTLTYNGNGLFTFTPLLASDSFGELANTPTTISGYGITDAMTTSAITTAIDSAIQTKDNTDEMTEGSTNLYHTTARARASISATGSLSYDNSTGVMSFTQGNTDTVTEGSTNLYYTDARADARITAATTSDLTEGSNLYYTDARVDARISGSDLSMGSNDIITTGKSLYSNMYSTEGDLPSATTYHGMFAHVHGTGKGYFSHAGSWHKLIDETNLSSQIDSAYVIARSPVGVDSGLIINTITDPKYLRSDVHDVGVSLSLSSTLHAIGAITSDGDITAFNSASDRKLKENIEVIDNAIDKVMSLSGYTFNYIGREEKMSGVIADEVESVLPEVVYEFDGEYKAVRYGNMMGLIIEAIKDLKSDIDELKEKIN